MPRFAIAGVARIAPMAASVILLWSDRFTLEFRFAESAAGKGSAMNPAAYPHHPRRSAGPTVVDSALGLLSALRTEPAGSESVSPEPLDGIVQKTTAASSRLAAPCSIGSDAPPRKLFTSLLMHALTLYPDSPPLPRRCPHETGYDSVALHLDCRTLRFIIGCSEVQ
jgi:hypothetical protein